VREVLVTGAAAVTPLGRDLETTAARLAAGESAFAEVPSEDGGPRRKPAFAARIASFTTEPEMPKAKARRLDRGSQYAVVAVTRCLADARWTTAGNEEETGIVLGTGSAGAGPLVELERQMALESPETASPFLFPYTVANAPASLAAIELKIKGPNVTITQKDPAGLNALYYSRFLLEDGRAKAIVAGAVDEWNLTYQLAYERLGVLRTASKPGFVLCEGCSVVLLEDGASARARGARPWARLAGAASAGARVSPQRRRARPEEVAATLRAALADAGVEPAGVGLVHASSNGVPWVDAAEAAALADVFGPGPRVERPKLLLGENPCAGALQLALAALALRDDPSLGAAVVNSLGAGGNQIAVVLASV
jgi:3-oxoacyl-[acyl-carrier-protein] synthase II